MNNLFIKEQDLEGDISLYSWDSFVAHCESLSPEKAIKERLRMERLMQAIIDKEPIVEISEGEFCDTSLNN